MNGSLITALKVMVTIPSKFNMDHLKFHLILESENKMERKWNKRNRRSQEKIKEVLRYFRYIKDMTLRENYKEALEVWGERNSMTRINIGAKLLLTVGCDCDC
jgi:hypothetical protein